MKCFDKNYAVIYDFLYTKKNYIKEFLLIKKIIKKNLFKPTHLLDLGCGTGQYSNLMTKLNLKVTGVDRSNNMLNIAKKKYKKNKKLNFIKSEIEKINIKKKFDIISALFHILSYQTSTSKIDNFFSKSHFHLNKNGILIFDFWYTDGVYNLQNPLRVREINNKSHQIVRITISKWFKKVNQIVDSHNLIVMDKKNKKISKFSEVHKMRYFDLKFIKKKLTKHKFKFIKSLDLETGKQLTSKSWGALVVAKRF